MNKGEWLGDPKTRAFKVPDHVGLLEVRQGIPTYKLVAPIRQTDGWFNEAWERLKSYRCHMGEHIHVQEHPPESCCGRGLFTSIAPPDGRYYLLGEEAECTYGLCKSGTCHFGAQNTLKWPCAVCKGTGTITTHRLVREDDESLRVEMHKGFVLTADHGCVKESRHPEHPDETRRLLFIGPAGERWETQR